MADVSSRETLSQAGHTDTAVQQQTSTQLQQQQAPPQQQQYKQALAEKDAQISVLQKKLEHYRSWLSSLQCQMQHKDPQVIKNARRLYIGGIPDGTKESDLRTFFDGIMNSTGASCGPGSSIVTCKISNDKSYAFLEMRSVEEASNAMAFDGVVFQDTNLKIRRPSNYSPSEAIALGPVIPDPTIDTTGLPMCKTIVEDSPEKIFIGGLPCHFTDEQVKDLLTPYGALKSFNLVMDKNTGKSKGYAFCEFADPASIPIVIEKLHMYTLERKVLTVKRACDGVRHGGGGGSASGGGRMSGTPLGYHQPYAPFGGPSSSGSSRGAYFPTPHAGPGAMRSGSYSSGSYSSGSYGPMQGGGPGGRPSGRGGSGTASPMHGGGGHRYSPQHGVYSPHGGAEVPFGGPPPPHLMMGPPHPGGYGVGYYVTPEGAASPIFPHGGHSMGVVPAHGPLHGWPTHGMLGPGTGSSGRGSSQRPQQQQYGSSSGRGSLPSGHRQGGPAGAGTSTRESASPSPVAPTYGTSRDPPSAPGQEARPVSGHRTSTTGSSGLYQHSSMGGASSTQQQQRPSDASSSHALEH